MPDPKIVLRHLFGTHTRAIAHWFGDIGPSITSKPAVFVILLPFFENPHALSLSARKVCRDVRMGNGAMRSSVAPHGWDQYAWDEALVHQYLTLHHF